ncbi:MAG: biotin-dependent carboxyltransferase family protein [Terrimicrobiaceae bacterium]|nr:biotin-dependent carboxyltransferase family protein [Terrimicrobiaceae bacterium]
MDALEILSTGAGMSVQDFGRHGWKRYGVPPSGAMDPHAAAWANRLAGNRDDAPVLELLLQGAGLLVLAARRFAVAGAEAGACIEAWHARTLQPGDRLVFPRNQKGLWTYVAAEGGFDVERVMGSASTYPRGGIGRALRAGDRLAVAGEANFAKVGEGWVAWGERRNYEDPPLLRIWKGPQWEWFDEMERTGFFSADWEVSNHSDRAGYRLEGARMNPPEGEMRSEPVLVGSIQVPPNGLPIVTMRDGPTVGGYPKIGIVDEGSLSWLAQCRPGVRFRMALIE